MPPNWQTIGTWIGNNDVWQSSDLSQQLTNLFHYHEKLYTVGARNFIFINVVPFDRSPGGKTPKLSRLIKGLQYNYRTNSRYLASRIQQWNSLLPTYASNFQSTHPNATVAVYDLHSLFNHVLDNYSQYGFKDNTSWCEMAYCLWSSDVHSTFAMHKIIASDMVRVLEGGSQSPPATSSMSPGAVPTFALAFTLAALLVGFLCWMLIKSTSFGVGTIERDSFTTRKFRTPGKPECK